MPKVIHKFILNKREPFTAIRMRAGAKVLTAAIQADDIVIWALLERDGNVIETRVFTVQLTGSAFEYNESSNRLDYINTVTSKEGFVYHVFEYVEIKPADQYMF